VHREPHCMQYYICLAYSNCQLQIGLWIKILQILHRVFKKLNILKLPKTVRKMSTYKMRTHFSSLDIWDKKYDNILGAPELNGIINIKYTALLYKIALFGIWLHRIAIVLYIVAALIHCKSILKVSKLLYFNVKHRCIQKLRSNIRVEECKFQLYCNWENYGNFVGT
jgi:hypothetical protein